MSSTAALVAQLEEFFDVSDVSAQDLTLEPVLPADRADRYRAFLSNPAHALVSAVTSDGREFVCEQAADGALTVLKVSCAISYDDLPVSLCPEFSFADEGEQDKWYLAQVSSDALRFFQDSKFKIWEESIRNPDCEAAFVRMLQAGLMYTLFDKNLFPTPAHLQDKYRVLNEANGKIVDVPHPVRAMRVWNAATKRYEEKDARLTGAPASAEDAAKYWNNLIEEFKQTRGSEYIDSLLAKK